MELRQKGRDARRGGEGGGGGDDVMGMEIDTDVTNSEDRGQ